MEDGDNEDEAIALSRDQFLNAIQTYVRIGKIDKVDALLTSFWPAWERCWLAPDADARPLRSIFNQVVNQCIVALLRNGLPFLTCTPLEVRAGESGTEAGAVAYHFGNDEFAQTIERLIALLYATADAPRLRIDVVLKYAEAVARPARALMTIPPPVADALTHFLLQQLHPQVLVAAEQAAAETLATSLELMQPEFAVQLKGLYEWTRRFDAPAVRSLSHATATLHRLGAWQLRLKAGERDPSEVSRQQTFPILPSNAELARLGIKPAKDGADVEVHAATHRSARIKVFGYTIAELEAAMRAPAANGGKRKRA